MTRPLNIVPAADPLELMPVLREALTAGGAAILPLPGRQEAVSAGEVPRQVGLVVETSGSTDSPKRVMLGTNALLAAAAASSTALGGPGQWLLALPGHYIAGIQVLVRSIAADTTPVVMPPGHFDPTAFIRHADRLTEPMRFTSIVPLQLARLLAAAETDREVLRGLRRFTAILVGGQAIQPELVERADQLDVHVVRTYGSSETSGGCVYDGRPIGNTLVRVIDGQVELSGAVLAEGYLGEPGRTSERFVEEHGVRWYRTGDLGEFDQETGVLRVLGRADNVIISGGEKVSLDAVQRVVRSLHGLGTAVVVAGDDEQWGQVPVVVVPTGTDARLTLIRDAVASALGKAARPASVVAVETIPHLPSGKPDLAVLRHIVASTPA